MKYAANGAYLFLIISCLLWLGRYFSVIMGRYRPGDTMRDYLFMGTNPSADLLFGILWSAILGAILGGIVALVTLPFRRRKTGEVDTESPAKRGVNVLAVTAGVLVVVAVLASMYATSQMASLASRLGM